MNPSLRKSNKQNLYLVILDIVLVRNIVAFVLCFSLQTKFHVLVVRQGLEINLKTNEIGCILTRIKSVKSKRITFVLDVSLEKKIRDIQVKKIQATNKSTSFSSIINSVLRNGLKN